MKAIVQDRYGPPQVLELRELNKPVVRDDEVLLRVRAASVNPGDWAYSQGVPMLVRLDSGLRKPRGVGGMGVAGVVEQAAAVPVAGITALQALRNRGQVGLGQKVLITGAGGGVGTFAVQIAKALGAEVTAVCSSGKTDLMRSIGADHVIDYTREDFTRSEVRYDFILDNAGHHSLTQARRVLAARGTLVPNNGRFEHRWLGSLGTVIGALLLSLVVRHKLRPFLSLPKTSDLESLRELVEAGKLTPIVDRTYSLRDTGKALAYFGEGHARGKVVIQVSGPSAADTIDDGGEP
jgi:NADPH:quinone reductase-like Zn-dependent oxidoreductase